MTVSSAWTSPAAAGTLDLATDDVLTETVWDALISNLLYLAYTNGRIVPHISTVTDSAAPTPNADTDDMFTVTALAQAATFGAPSGTPRNGQKLIIRIKDNGTARALSWNAAYVASGVTLPSTTVLGKIMHVGFIYNTDNGLNKWCCVASAQEA